MNKEQRAEFHRRLYGIYENSGLTQEEMAKQIGLGSRSTLAKYLNGNTPVPSDKLYDFCVAMNCTPNYLFGFEDADSVSLAGLPASVQKEVRALIRSARKLSMGK